MTSSYSSGMPFWFSSLMPSRLLLPMIVSTVTLLMTLFVTVSTVADSVGDSVKALSFLSICESTIEMMLSPGTGWYVSPFLK